MWSGVAVAAYAARTWARASALRRGRLGGSAAPDDTGGSTGTERPPGRIRRYVESAGLIWTQGAGHRSLQCSLDLGPC